MSYKKFINRVECGHGCPDPPVVLVKHTTSTRMRQAQILKQFGFVIPGNKHTPNLPGTRRQHNRKPKVPPTWPCGSDPAIIGNDS